jgi:hypothetical protein
MFNRLLTSLPVIIAAAIIVVTPALAEHSKSQTQSDLDTRLEVFDSQAAAQSHCPTDTVVWIKPGASTYHAKGLRWYGGAGRGTYACKKEADAAGYRDTEW